MRVASITTRRPSFARCALLPSNAVALRACSSPLPHGTVLPSVLQATRDAPANAAARHKLYEKEVMHKHVGRGWWAGGVGSQVCTVHPECKGTCFAATAKRRLLLPCTQTVDFRKNMSAVKKRAFADRGLRLKIEALLRWQKVSSGESTVVLGSLLEVVSSPTNCSRSPILPCCCLLQDPLGMSAPEPRAVVENLFGKYGRVEADTCKVGHNAHACFWVCFAVGPAPSVA